ncbi:MAG: hypothetical protein PVH65_15465, partial [Chloroflexota bacterium]
MENIYVFLIRNDIWIYILCGLGFIWYLAQLIRSRSMLRRSMFGLEIERGRRAMRRALFLVFLCLVIAGAVSYVNLSIAPTLPPELLKPPTPTPNIFITPLSSPTPAGGGQATPTIFLAPTVTLAPSGPVGPAETTPAGTQAATDEPATGELEPTAEESPQPGDSTGNCPAGINITSPPTSAIVSASVTFFGNATAEDFGYYALEANGPQTGGAWIALPVEEARRQ